jgi:hypothetical protein
MVLLAVDVCQLTTMRSTPTCNIRGWLSFAVNKVLASHITTCLLENALNSDGATGAKSDPVTSVGFNYDKFSSFTTIQFCEAV